MVFEGGKGDGWALSAEKIPADSLLHGCIMLFLSPFYFTRNLIRILLSQKYPTLSVFSGYFWYSCHTMAFVEISSFHHYQPSNAGLRRNEQPTASKLHVFTACRKGNDPTALGPSKKPSGILQNYDLIEILNLDDPSPKEPFNQFHMSTKDFDDIQKDPESTVLRRCIR